MCLKENYALGAECTITPQRPSDKTHPLTVEKKNKKNL